MPNMAPSRDPCFALSQVCESVVSASRVSPDKQRQYPGQPLTSPSSSSSSMMVLGLLSSSVVVGSGAANCWAALCWAWALKSSILAWTGSDQGLGGYAHQHVCERGCGCRSWTAYAVSYGETQDAHGIKGVHLTVVEVEALTGKVWRC